MKYIDSSPSNYQTIADSILFKNINDVIIRFAMQNKDAQWCEYEKGEIIYSKNMFKRSVALVVEGKVAVRKEVSEGKKMILANYGPSEMFGGTALFQPTDSFVAEVQAEQKCVIFFLSQELLQDLFRTDILIAENYIRFLTQSLIFLSNKIDSFISGSAEERLAKFLLENIALVSCYTKTPY